jgi:hypothetical protein
MKSVIEWEFTDPYSDEVRTELADVEGGTLIRTTVYEDREAAHGGTRWVPVSVAMVFVPASSAPAEAFVPVSSAGPKGFWRLLEVGEKVLPGDEFLEPQKGKWLDAFAYEGEVVGERYHPHRRRIWGADL